MRIISTVFLEIRCEPGMYDRELLSKKRNVTIPMDVFVNGDITLEQVSECRIVKIIRPGSADSFYRKITDVSVCGKVLVISW